MAKKGGKSSKKKKDGLNADIPQYPNQIIKLEIDIPPSKNHAYFYRRGQKIMKKTTQDYIKKIRKEVENEMWKQDWKKDKIHVWYYADLYFFFPDKRIRDSHNSIEVLMDTLEGTIFPNDYHIMPRIQNVILDRKNPRLYIEFYPKPTK